MESIIIIAIIALGTGFLAAYSFFRQRGAVPEESQGLLLLQQQMAELARGNAELARVLDQKLSESAKGMHESLQYQMSESQKLMQSITSQMTAQLTQVQKGMTESFEQSKKVLTITEQLQKLEKVLTHQKQRGSLGERSLTLILENVLPPGVFKLQYCFKNGDAVDAVIETKEGVIPIDAKFSLDNYTRYNEATDDAVREEIAKIFKEDLKRRIDETAKYIRPEEGTLPFAFMYIPAEGIYYDLIVNEIGAMKINTRNLIDYAMSDKKVIIVSPTTLLAYLQTVLQGLRSLQIEESTKEIIKRVEDLSRHLKAFGEYHDKIGSSLGTAVNQWNLAHKEFVKIDKDVTRIAGERIGVESFTLDRPSKEE